MSNSIQVFNLTCDGRNKTHIGILSTLCVNGSFDVNLCNGCDGVMENLCMPEDEKRSWRMALGIWGLIVSLIGIVGNIFTLLAVPYAAQRKRFGVKKNWNTLQVFVLHLAICDLLYCSIPLPFYSSLYIGGQWYFGEIWCKLTSILAHVFAYNSWMALALIAFSRALALPDTDVWKRLCDNGGSKKIILLAWIVNLLILLPSLLEKSLTYGYNCGRGKCDLFETGIESNLNWFGREMPHYILTFLPVVIIISCYLFIYCHMRKATKRISDQRASLNLQRQGSNVEERNAKVTLNIFVLCFCYIACTLPHVIYSYFYHRQDLLYDVLLGFYWLQYGFNIALYVAQRAQYWNAYKLYIREKIVTKCPEPKVVDQSSTSAPGRQISFQTPTSKNYVFFNF